MIDKMDWVDKREEERSKDYFDIEEGDNRLQILTHCAPQPLKWTGTKYEPAEEGDTNVSIKGVCWVLQDGALKLAKLPYTVVKAIRAFQKAEETSFSEFPMPYAININAKGAGEKTVEYNVIPSRKESPVSEEVLTELKKKPSPEEMVDKMKGKSSAGLVDQTEPEVDPKDVPF